MTLYNVCGGKISEVHLLGRDIEYVENNFFELNPQLVSIKLDFSQYIDDISAIIPLMKNIDDITLEGFSPMYSIDVNLRGLTCRTLTLINCRIDGSSLSTLTDLESLSICNCITTDETLNYYISGLRLMELHDLSDDPPTLLAELPNAQFIDLRYINMSIMRRLTIQYICHDRYFPYPNHLKLLRIINTHDSNIIIKCSKETSVMLSM